jgi:lipid-binding SYLF domain-containing protein
MMLAILLLCISGIASAQGKDVKKITNAIERAKNATEVLKQVAALPEDKGIPKEVREKMNLIGVIPNALRLSLLFSKGYRGYGLSSLKKDGVCTGVLFLRGVLRRGG